jgi:DnaA regulatory inactivator Hda
VNDGRQLPLNLEHRPSLDGADFLVADSNRHAVAWLDHWPQWPQPALVIYGESGCGKSHLAQVFLRRTGGRLVRPAHLAAADPLAFVIGARACVVDDAERVLAAGLEEPLLHLYNTLAECGGHLLITARQPPARLPFALADLRSRLNAAPSVAIGPPDEALMRAVILKLFADRQLKIDDAIADYMVMRMERSFACAGALVAAIDAAAMAAKRRISVSLVRDVLGEHANGDGEDR